jgi:hypothetical protein
MRGSIVGRPVEPFDVLVNSWVDYRVGYRPGVWPVKTFPKKAQTQAEAHRFFIRGMIGGHGLRVYPLAGLALAA